MSVFTPVFMYCPPSKGQQYPVMLRSWGTHTCVSPAVRCEKSSARPHAPLPAPPAGASSLKGAGDRTVDLMPLPRILPVS